jgi:hypothetical protein
MANKRSLKRCISYICGELFAECISVSAYYNSDKQNADALLRCIMRIHSDYIMRVSHPEPGMPAKKYYKSLIADFNNSVNEVVDHIKNLHA